MANVLFIVLAFLATKGTAEDRASCALRGPNSCRPAETTDALPKLKPSERINLLQAQLDEVNGREHAAAERERSLILQLKDKETIIGLTDGKLARAELEANSLTQEIKKSERASKLWEDVAVKIVLAQAVLGVGIFLSLALGIAAFVYSIKSYRLQKRKPPVK